MTRQEVALEALKNLVDGLNATEFPMGVWERTEFNLLVKLREDKNKAEAAIKLLESQEGCNQPTIEHLNELYELSDEPTIQGNEFYLRGFKDRENWQTKPVEGDVRAEALEALEKFQCDSVYPNALISLDTKAKIVDALLSKFNFTRKG